MTIFEHILVPLDGSTLAECVLPHLIGLVRAFEAQVTVLSVLEPPNTGKLSFPVDPVAWDMKKSELNGYINEVAGRLEEQGMPAEPVLLEGSPAKSINSFADKNDVDLILLSSHGRGGLSRWNVSGIVRKVIQRTNRSFMLVRAYQSQGQRDMEPITYKKLMLTLDGSRRAECLFSPAKALAQYNDARMILAHVVVKPEMPRRMPLTEEDQDLLTRFIDRNKQVASEYIESLRTRLDYEYESCLRVSGNVSLTLHELVDEKAVDLMLMSAHGVSGRSNWPFGSNTTSFIEYGSVPLLVVQDFKPEEIGKTRAETTVKEAKGH